MSRVREAGLLPGGVPFRSLVPAAPAPTPPARVVCRNPAAAHEEDKTKCAVELDAYKASCMRSWRKYFDGRRRAGKGQVDVATYHRKD